MARTPNYYSYYKTSKGDWILIQALGKDGLEVLKLCGWKVEKLDEKEGDNAQVKNKKKDA